MNTSSQRWTDWALKQLVNNNSSEAGAQTDPYIRIRSNSSSGKIESVVADTEYNRDKGYLNVRESGGEWIIEVTHIETLCNVESDCNNRQSSAGKFPWQPHYPSS